MRLLITGKSRSGKSTALHCLVRAALAVPWLSILLADGKGVELPRYAMPQRPVFGPGDAEALAQALTAQAAALDARYTALITRGLREAPPDAPRALLIIDEVQVFTRHPQHGKAVRDALTRLAEQSGALGDILILTSQRATGAVPPAVRVNIDTQLRLLGAGYFQLVADGHSTRQGRVDPAAPPGDAAQLAPIGLPEVLGMRPLEHQPTLVTRYEGLPGSGKTHALQQHTDPACARRVLLDCRAHTHRSLLLDCLQQCGATPPDGAPITELTEAAALALAATSTLLLLDNVDGASAKARDSLQTLLDAATAAAISLPPPIGDDPARDPLAALRRRGTLVSLHPLDHDQATALVRQVAPALDAASVTAILKRAAGNPQALVTYAGRVAAHGPVERHQIEPVRRPARWLSVLLMFATLVFVILIQRQIANDLAGAVLSALVVLVMWFLRPRFREATRR